MDTYDAKIFAKVKQALHVVRIEIPFLAPLTHEIELIPETRIETAGIFASGRLIFNPTWLSEQSLSDITFIIAHEIMHLALRSHSRSSIADHKLFNITHDFIINDMLKKILERNDVPAGGLDWQREFSGYYELEGKSAEELMSFVKDALDNGKLGHHIFIKPWMSGRGVSGGNTAIGETLLKALGDNKLQSDLIQEGSDVFSEEFEKELYPDLVKRTLIDRRDHISQKIEEAHNLKFIQEQDTTFISRLMNPGASASKTYQSIKSYYQPPWEVALQSWLESTQRSGRTYSRPSRRGQYQHFIRPGVKREGQTLHIVLDTSGSMTHILQKILGVIATFCENLLIPEIHLIQCDTKVSDDQWVTPEELMNFEIKGLGGSDMSPGMYRLAEDDQVESAIVITDGFIHYPNAPMPYEVLWVMTHQDASRPYFNPSYGTIIPIENRS